MSTTRPRGNRVGRALRAGRARFRALPRLDRLRLVAWLVAVGVLAGVGLGVGDRLHRTEPKVDDTAAARATALAERKFGRRQQLIVTLEGPPAVLRAQGPAVAKRIAGLPHTQVVGPWRPPERSLAPAPNRAILMIAIGESFERVSDDSAPRLRRLMPNLVDAPLRWHMSGYPDIAHAIHTTTVSAIERSEMIAAPALLVVLMLVLGSVVAASLPLFLGGCVVGAGTGVLDIVNRFAAIDVTALNLSTMMGLALGVDYSLLLLSRFRAELAAGASVDEAVDGAAARAGRTVTFAGLVLALAMIGALVLMPGAILRSAAVGALVAVGLSLLGARVALPPLLRFVGHDINRLQLLPGAAQSPRWGAFALRVIRRPVLAMVVGVLVVLAVGAPTLSIETGAPDPLNLPKDSAVRKDFEAVERSVGSARAWTAPTVLTVAERQVRLDPRRVREMGRALVGLKRRLVATPRTLSVLGPEPSSDRSAAQFVIVDRRQQLNQDYQRRVERAANAVAEQTGTTAAVGGPGPLLDDFDRSAKDKLPLLIVVLVGISYVALVPILRSFILPLIAAILNVLTVLAAFGALTLAFGGDAPLGGPGFVDNIMVDIVFSVVLALSIDYEVFLLDRMREGFAKTGTVDGAIAYGLEHTAGVITGAAAIMLAVFLAFAISPVITMRQLGVGLSVAVALDATVVRLVLLPAALRLAGPRAWRLPRVLERRSARREAPVA